MSEIMPQPEPDQTSEPVIDLTQADQPAEAAEEAAVTEETPPRDLSGLTETDSFGFPAPPLKL